MLLGFMALGGWSFVGVLLLVFWPGSLGFWWLRAVGSTRIRFGAALGWLCG